MVARDEGHNFRGHDRLDALKIWNYTSIIQTVCLCIIILVVIAHFLPPVNCDMPDNPVNGSIEPPQSTLTGSVIEFGCDPGFIPAERMTATCMLNGNWSPDPGTLVCNGKVTWCDLTDTQLVWVPWFVYIAVIWESFVVTVFSYGKRATKNKPTKICWQ